MGNFVVSAKGLGKLGHPSHLINVVGAYCEFTP